MKIFQHKNFTQEKFLAQKFPNLWYLPVHVIQKWLVVGQGFKNHKCTLTFYDLSSSLTHSLLDQVLPRLLLNTADILN